MKLEKFKEKNKTKKGIIIFTICCVLLIGGVFFYSSFALFETKETFNIVNGKIHDPGDLYFAYYIDDQITDDFPKKESGYIMSLKSFCNNGVSVLWDNENWQAQINYSNYERNSNSRTKCNLYFEKRTFENSVVSCGKLGEDIASCMLKNAYLDTENLMYDETVDNNLRYVGKDPNNYVTFNNELWRIIGVMNNVEDGNGKKASRIKLMRNESIGAYSWDTSETNINGGWGVNEWSEAKIMKLLNPGFEGESVGGSLYWNKGSGSCYNEKSNATTSCDFTTNGLENNTKDQIEEVIWNTGAVYEYLMDDLDKSIEEYYNDERSTMVGKHCTSGTYCNDSVTRTTKWKGKVGLIYPSDCGFATKGTEEIPREECLKKGKELWKCQESNWMKFNKIKVMTITPSSHSGQYASFIVHMGSSKSIHTNGPVYDREYDIFPTIYLKTNISIISGNGSKEEPYILR